MGSVSPGSRATALTGLALPESFYVNEKHMALMEPELFWVFRQSQLNLILTNTPY